MKVQNKLLQNKRFILIKREVKIFREVRYEMSFLRM